MQADIRQRNIKFSVTRQVYTDHQNTTLLKKLLKLEHRLSVKESSDIHYYILI